MWGEGPSWGHLQLNASTAPLCALSSPPNPLGSSASGGRFSLIFPPRSRTACCCFCLRNSSQVSTAPSVVSPPSRPGPCSAPLQHSHSGELSSAPVRPCHSPAHVAQGFPVASRVTPPSPVGTPHRLPPAQLPASVPHAPRYSCARPSLSAPGPRLCGKHMVTKTFRDGLQVTLLGWKQALGELDPPTQGFLCPCSQPHCSHPAWMCRQQGRLGGLG